MSGASEEEDNALSLGNKRGDMLLFCDECLAQVKEI